MSLNPIDLLLGAVKRLSRSVEKVSEAAQAAGRDPLDWLTEEMMWEYYEHGVRKVIAAQRNGKLGALRMFPPDESDHALLKQFAEMAIELRAGQPRSADAVDPSAASTGTPSTRD